SRLRPRAATMRRPPSLHDALPISRAGLPLQRDMLWSMRSQSRKKHPFQLRATGFASADRPVALAPKGSRSPSVRLPPETLLNTRSEEHTSELQSRENLVCRLLLEK